MRKAYILVFALVLLLACSRKASETVEQAQPSALASAQLAAAPSAATTAAASSALPSPANTELVPVCSVESKKVWVSGANQLTGLTEATLPDGRAAIGFAVGTQPRVLLVGANAKGTLVKVPVAKTSRLASLPKGATRSVLRVTPVKVEGENVQAFVDFEDRYQDKKHTVVCGPTDTNENWVEDDAIPCSAHQSAKPAELAAAFHQAGAEKICDEVHSCRSFTDLGRGEPWVLSSEVHGVLQADNSVVWSTDLAVATGSKTNKRIIESMPVNKRPLEESHYEVPVAHALKNGAFLLATRYADTLAVGILGPDKSLVGKFTRYTGPPTLPDIAEDGADALVVATSFAMGKGEFGLRAMRIAEDKPELPKSMHVVVTDKANAQTSSESDPDFVHDAQGRRWLAHIEGPRGEGKLSLAPLNKDFQAIGRSYTVTEPGERAVSARLVPLKDKGILVVFLRAGDKSVDLVSEEVHCKIEQ
jgi:hypothetical protein